MSNRTLTYLSIAVVACIGLLLVINLIPSIQGISSGKYLQLNDVRGSAVQHKGLLYTLNFDQQNHLVDWLNHSVAVKSDSYKKDPDMEIEKIVVYLFNKPDLEIEPIAYSNGNLVFSSPKWNASGLFIDTSNGVLKQMLSETYDH